MLPGPVPVPRRPLSPRVPATGTDGHPPARRTAPAAQGLHAGRPGAVTGGPGGRGGRGWWRSSCRAPSTPPRSSRSSPGRWASAGATGPLARSSLTPSSTRCRARPSAGPRPGPGRAPDRDRPPGQLPYGHRPGGGAGPGPARMPGRAQGNLRRRDPEPRGDRGRCRYCPARPRPALPEGPARPARERPAARRAGGVVPPHACRPVRQPAAPAVVGTDASAPIWCSPRWATPTADGACTSPPTCTRQQKCSAWKAGSAAGWPATSGPPHRHRRAREGQRASASLISRGHTASRRLASRGRGVRTAARLAGAVLAATGLCAVTALPAQADAVRDQEMWVLDMVHAPSAWPVTQGQGVTRRRYRQRRLRFRIRPGRLGHQGPDLSGVNTPPVQRLLGRPRDLDGLPHRRPRPWRTGPAASSA